MARRRQTKTGNKKKKELQKQLQLSILGIFAFAFGGILLFNFFGPQIGALFGFISVYRNDSGPEARATLTPPTFYDLPEATNEKQIDVRGFAPSAANVILYINGPQKGEVLVGGDGQFHFENVELIEGRNTIFAKSVDTEGNQSKNSETQIIIMDDEKPDITIEEPSDGDTIKNLNRRVLIRGKISEEAKVTVNDRLAVLQPNNSFEYLLGVNEGAVEVTVKAVDEAGNERLKIFTINYVEDAD